MNLAKLNTKVPTREEIERLQTEMAKMPQVELNTEHYFNDGMYCRKLFIKAGSLIVGKVHKKDHLFICAKGQIITWSETGMRTLNASDVIESKASTKRVILALTDAAVITVHKTDKIDITDVEADLVEDDPLALYGPGNILKDKLIEN
jgi:quercetin dioxygenase-like cupin family protein